MPYETRDDCTTDRRQVAALLAVVVPLPLAMIHTAKCDVSSVIMVTLKSARGEQPLSSAGHPASNRAAGTAAEGPEHLRDAVLTRQDDAAANHRIVRRVEERLGTRLPVGWNKAASPGRTEATFGDAPIVQI